MSTGSANSLSTLLQQSSLDDHEEILKAANNVLKKSKHDLTAQRVRLIALLQLDRYEDAARVVVEGGAALEDVARLECAYALYKSGSLEAAEKTALGATTQRGLEHVLAQIHYRAEKFEKAAERYEKLAREASVNQESHDLRINRSANDAQLYWAGRGHLAHKKKLDREDLEQFETTYNAACSYVAKGELKQAALLLARAKDLCNAATELSAAEKASEILPIQIQQIYVHCRMGKIDEAEKLLSSLDIASISDQSTQHIARVNSLVASSTPPNPYLSHRVFHSTSQASNKDLPFAFQSDILKQDSAVLDLQAGKYAGVAESTSSQLAAEDSGIISTKKITASVLNTAASIRNANGKAALRRSLSMLEKKPQDIGVLLTTVQLYLSTSNPNAATDLVSQFLSRLEQSSNPADQQIRYAPGLVGLTVALYSQQNRSAEIRSQLAQAAKFWKQSSTPARGSPALLKMAGRELLMSATSPDIKASHEIFSSVYEQDHEDPIAIAGYVASTDDIEAPSIEQLARKLPSVDKLIAGIDIDALESAGVARLPVAVVDASRKRTGDSDVKAGKAKKTRTSRLPKDYDPSKTPDPERWLPMRDRSNYRPKGKKKAKGGGAATQGGVVSEDSRPATPSAVHQAKPAVAKSKKKKAKGGK